ncbi:DNA polymerase III subunit gamma/tau [Parvularcula lutaonensis]|uniref:DNA polymerase III subunit gamma/tau n=1 Tax=Parvularcula lutaonensis TaxID=491923 RepID=A0ABV7MA38_9PROT|nr:DNA polymerase III subunit gamma/tau [Parvularcula lutaonensis]GGY46960.1 DNA polymerase III subunit gamma/tau [Parvularcula lutaonensis]
MTEQTPYQVLARKYRPTSFDDLLGHDVMIRTLRNAFEADRIAHAFILTGVRGVGKTTTARIMARALNYETEDIDRPTVDMAVEGKHCRAIAEGRHPDVIEMDAASRTGVDDIRELIEGVRYAPTVGRYKVYIVDEVHMLSKNAFNAFLKTLEEPPAHVKFIFATTEIRKVPITVLSRCQRFDLARFDAQTLGTYLGSIAEKEGVQAEEEALELLGRAAQGSVRDGLSLLDQAILSRQGDTIEADAVRRMIGLADRGYSWSLLEAVLKGDSKEALRLFRHQYDYGADPAEVIRDLLDVTHLVTRTKAAGEDAAAHGPAGTADAAAAKRLAAELSLPAMTRTWSLLMTALREVQGAPDPAAAAEVGLIRLAFASRLPTPGEVIAGASVPPGKPEAAAAEHAPEPERAEEPAPAAEPGDRLPSSLKEIAALAAEHGELRLKNAIERKMRLVSFEGQRIVFAPTDDAEDNLAGRIQAALIKWTGAAWDVEVGSATAAEPTLKEQRDAAIQNHPLVKEALKTFPGATIAEVRPIGGKE